MTDLTPDVATHTAKCASHRFQKPKPGWHDREPCDDYPNLPCQCDCGVQKRRDLIARHGVLPRYVR